MSTNPAPITELLAIMARLRDKNGGCPWDIEQNFATIAPYTIEEAYEVSDAIAKNDMPALKDELGDLLFQVVFHAQMAAEAGHFNFDDVVKNVSEKMLRRHPHVFGDADVKTADAQVENWEVIKAEERAKKNAGAGVLGDIPSALPELMRAQKISKRAARVGFDWPDLQGVIEKVEEELDEVLAAASQGDEAGVHEEMGDLLFAVTNLSRALDVDAEEALRSANRKFMGRFAHMEAALKATGKRMEDLDLDALEALWQQAKHAEVAA